MSLKVLVVGGASGIGSATVRRFRNSGNQVVVADIDEAKAKSLVEENLQGPGYSVFSDMSKAGSPKEVVGVAAQLMGGLDVVFANAGVLKSAPLLDWRLEDWEYSMAVNLRAPFFLAQAAVPFLLESTNASIIFNASTGAFRGHAGMPAYHASKAGLVNLVRALADELSPKNIRVNAVCPGWIDTPFNDPYWSFQSEPNKAIKQLEQQIPMRRQGLPDEVASVVEFLSSKSSSYITAQAIVIDGGYVSV